MQSRPWIDTTVNDQRVEVTWYTTDSSTDLGTLVVRRSDTTTRYHPVARDWYDILANAGYRFDFVLSAATCSPRPPAHATRVIGALSGRLQHSVSLTATRIIAALEEYGMTVDEERGETVAAASVAVSLTKHGNFDKHGAIQRVSDISSYSVDELSRGREAIVGRLYPKGTLEEIAEADRGIQQHQIPSKIQESEPEEVYRTQCDSCDGRLTVDAVQYEHAYGQRDGAVFTHSTCGQTSLYTRSDWTQADEGGMSE